MNNLQRDVVRDILNGIVVIAMIVVISIGIGLLITSPAHADEGCTVQTVETEEFTIAGTAL